MLFIKDTIILDITIHAVTYSTLMSQQKIPRRFRDEYLYQMSIKLYLTRLLVIVNCYGKCPQRFTCLNSWSQLVMCGFGSLGNLLDIGLQLADFWRGVGLEVSGPTLLLAMAFCLLSATGITSCTCNHSCKLPPAPCLPCYDGVYPASDNPGPESIFSPLSCFPSGILTVRRIAQEHTHLVLWHFAVPPHCELTCGWA